MTDIKPAEASVSLLMSAKDQLNTLLKDSPILLITINSQLESMINRISLLNGVQNIIGGLSKEELDIKFPPIPGENDGISKPVTKEDLKPVLSKKEQFILDVENFSRNIFDMDNSKILDTFVTIEDITVIRGAAKAAGIQDFKTAEINGNFLDQIRINITAQKEAIAKKIAKNADIAEQSNS